MLPPSHHSYEFRIAAPFSCQLPHVMSYMLLLFILGAKFFLLFFEMKSGESPYWGCPPTIRHISSSETSNGV
jgi:hypothetical protein